MKVSIITIGDEILIGQIVDTNSAWIAARLNEIGLEIHKIYSIADTPDAITRTLDRATQLSDLVLLTGGLGPTKDDITKKTLAQYFNTELVRNNDVLIHIENLFATIGLNSLNELNKQQADLPKKCRVLINKVGTASGMWFEKDSKHIISMPGVPFEMKSLMRDYILPEFKVKFSNQVIIHNTILTQGIPESILAQQLSFWEESLPNTIKLAYLPSINRVRLRLSARGQKASELQSLLDEQKKLLREIIPKNIFGEEKETLEERIGTHLKLKKATLATAESCTGGYLAHLITRVPGSSAYYKGSILAYANQVKTDLLGVSNQLLKKNGAVSKQVVEAMALGVKKQMLSDYAIATSGIAGPEGGTDKKPVGTIWVAIAGPSGLWSNKYNFGANRMANIKRTASSLLMELLYQLESERKK